MSNERPDLRWLRAAGVISAVGAVGFVLFIAVGVRGQAPSQLMLVPFVLWAVGPLTMIVHLQLSRSLSDDDKAAWRKRLFRWDAAIVPVEYLLTAHDRLR